MSESADEMFYSRHARTHARMFTPLQYFVAEVKLFLFVLYLCCLSGTATVAANEIGNNHLGVYKQSYSP